MAVSRAVRKFEKNYCGMLNLTAITPMRLKFVIVLSLLALSSIAFANPHSITDLPSSYCQEEFNSDVSRAGTVDSKCVLEFVTPKAYDEKSYEMVAIISLSGKLTKVFRESFNFTPGKRSKKQPSLGDRYSYVFFSKDRTIKVTLRSRIVSSSCYIDTESCCGDNYEGTLRIEENGEKSVVSVVYYRGG